MLREAGRGRRFNGRKGGWRERGRDGGRDRLREEGREEGRDEVKEEGRAGWLEGTLGTEDGR